MSGGTVAPLALTLDELLEDFALDELVELFALDELLFGGVIPLELVVDPLEVIPLVVALVVPLVVPPFEVPELVLGFPGSVLPSSSQLMREVSSTAQSPPRSR